VTGNIFSGLTAGADNTAIFFEDNPNGGTVTVSGNQFNGTAFYGVAIHPKDLPGGTNNYNYTVTAEDNWWGSASGAKHSSNTFNVGSQGNAVSNNVDFVPWLNAASPGGARFAPVTTTDTVGSYASIQAGVTASNSGGTVNMAAGTFTETVAVSKSLILRGANAGISAGANPGTRGAESIINGGIEISASNVIIDGFQIQGGNLGSDAPSCGIYILANYGGHTISNNKFPGPGTSTESRSRGILFGYTISDVTVKDNEISNWLSGIYINPSSNNNLTVTGNNFHGNNVAIGSDGLNNVTVQNNNFTGNTEGWGAGTVGANVQGHNNNFVGNGEAIHNYGGQVIDATNNWWGHASGPYDPLGTTEVPPCVEYTSASNVDGTGDKVSDNVLYCPWTGMVESTPTPTPTPTPEVTPTPTPEVTPTPTPEVTPTPTPTPTIPPTVITKAVSSVTTKSATLQGYLDLGGESKMWVSFKWGLTTAYSSGETTQKPMSSSGDFSFPLSGLLPGTTYHYRAHAVGSEALGDDMSFTTPGVSGGGGGGGGCFIATAAYGSYLDSHVDTLRSFRDQYLETNPIGSAFVSLYYKVSPPMADFIEKHPTLKPIVRAGLWPAVAMSSVALNTTLAEKAVILVAMALFTAALIMWLRRRTRRLDWGRNEVHDAQARK